ncbi:APC family permease [Geotalea uraniireducens]|uniref:Amino acid/polyamine/organocation transporter, APC superfamily n=1 Tax=Geotalea uraniireducens (strain Rf4) TaxID=351605 RepID=A5GA16_GEOUR|nr:APC family permease [Geotalea uraniireducens]ABQ25587.1 amino acid/polyamine/organocation transporter, APC superfamily [Geotalea uraniireducens Rf4]
MHDQQPPAQLQKTITLWKGLALAVSTVIGSGLLGLPGMALEIGNVHTVVGGWLLISLMLIPLVYIFAYLGLTFTSSAGLSKYAQVSIGDWGGHAVTAVLCGTFMVGIPVLALIGGAYAQNMCGFSENAVFVLAIGILVLSTGFNLLGVAATNWINTASLIALVAMTAVIVLSNASFFIIGINTFGETLGGKGHLNYNDLWRTAALLFWAFIGWENLSFSMEEFKNPSKTIPAVYWISFVIVIALYMALTITSIGAEVSGVSVKGASGLASLVNRTPIGMLLVVIMVVVITANACAWVMGASRLYYASGRDGILPSIIGTLTNKGIPLNSLLLSLMIYSAVIIAAYHFKLPPANLVLVVSQNFLVLYLISIFAYWKTERRSRRWFITVLGLLSCAFLLSGFSWWILYPVFLVGVGYCNYCRIKLKTAIYEKIRQR